MASFGERLKQIREARRLTQHDLAHRLRQRGFGTTQTTVSRWESGQAPRGYVLAALAAELGVTVDELLGSSDEDEEAASMPTHHELLEALRPLAELFNAKERVA